MSDAFVRLSLERSKRVANLSEAGHEERLVFIEALVSWQFLHQVLDESARSGIDILIAEGTAVCRDVGQELMQEDARIAIGKNIVFQVFGCLWLELLLVLKQQPPPQLRRQRYQALGHMS